MLCAYYSNTGLWCLKIGGQKHVKTNVVYLENRLAEFKVVARLMLTTEATFA